MEQINDLCAITEASNRFFANSRLAISTFIKHNTWFEGTVVVLTLESNPLTSENIKNINLIYDKIKILEISDDNLILIKNRIAKKGWDSNSMLDYLYLIAFDIKSHGSIYFSRNVVFQKNISFLLGENKLSVPVSSQKFPCLDVNSVELIDHSLMYIPSDILDMQIKSNLEENLLNDNIFKLESISNSLIKSLTLDNINKVSNQYLISSSNFPNNKYVEFTKYNKAIYAIKMNTIGTDSKNYSRINIYWNHLNKSIINDLSKPMFWKDHILKKSNAPVYTFKESNDSYSQYVKFFYNKSVIIVGPSPCILGKGYGEYIDSFDIVIRTNGGINLTLTNPFDYGTRCDVLYINSYYSSNLDLEISELINSSNVLYISSKTVDRIPNDVLVSLEPTILSWREFRSLRNKLKSAPISGAYIIYELSLFKNIKHIVLTGVDFYKNQDNTYAENYLPNNFKYDYHINDNLHNYSAQSVFIESLINSNNYISHLK
jgi:hypothetical protein